MATSKGNAHEGEVFVPAKNGVSFRDKEGNIWRSGSWQSADGTRGETYGPGHPNPPQKVVELREAERAQTAQASEEPAEAAEDWRLKKPERG